MDIFTIPQRVCLCHAIMILGWTAAALGVGCMNGWLNTLINYAIPHCIEWGERDALVGEGLVGIGDGDGEVG